MAKRAKPSERSNSTRLLEGFLCGIVGASVVAVPMIVRLRVRKPETSSATAPASPATSLGSWRADSWQYHSRSGKLCGQLLRENDSETWFEVVMYDRAGEQVLYHAAEKFDLAEDAQQEMAEVCEKRERDGR